MKRRTISSAASVYSISWERCSDLHTQKQRNKTKNLCEDRTREQAAGLSARSKQACTAARVSGSGYLAHTEQALFCNSFVTGVTPDRPTCGVARSKRIVPYGH